jgi:hypothetical protein
VKQSASRLSYDYDCVLPESKKLYLKVCQTDFSADADARHRLEELTKEVGLVLDEGQFKDTDLIVEALKQKVERL